jgi:hypothetical protein
MDSQIQLQQNSKNKYRFKPTKDQTKTIALISNNHRKALYQFGSVNWILLYIFVANWKILEFQNLNTKIGWNFFVGSFFNLSVLLK